MWPQSPLWPDPQLFPIVPSTRLASAPWRWTSFPHLPAPLASSHPLEVSSESPPPNQGHLFVLVYSPLCCPLPPTGLEVSWRQALVECSSSKDQSKRGSSFGPVLFIALLWMVLPVPLNAPLGASSPTVYMLAWEALGGMRWGFGDKKGDRPAPSD